MAWTSPKTWTSAVLSSTELNTHLRDNLLHICSTTGNLTVTSTGPHGIGTTVDAQVQLKIAGSFTPGSGALGVGTMVTPTISPGATRDCYAFYVLPTIVEAGSGTHNLFASAFINAPTITAGAGATTFAATLFISGAPTGASTNVPLYIEGGGHDDVYVALSSTDVSHGVTSVASTTFFGVLRKASATEGGISIQGFSEGSLGLYIYGVTTTAVTTEAGGSSGAITLTADFKSGTSTTTFAADDNIVVFKQNVNATHIFKADGSSWQDATAQTAWNVYDDFNDVALIENLEYEITAIKGNPIKRQFTEWMVEQRGALERLRLATFNDDGTIYVNQSGIQSLLCGFARQCAARVTTLEARVTALEAARG
jgi:hypothetical protein